MSFGGTADAAVLLTSIVQAGAALVAIVAGLLGSRYVAMHGERQAAQRRLADVQRRLAAATARRDAADDALVDRAVRHLLDHDYVYETITQSGATSPPLLDDVLEGLDSDGEGLPREALQAHLELLTEEIRRAFDEIEPAMGRLGHRHAWAAFRRAAQLQPKHHDSWEWVYRQMARERRMRVSVLGGMPDLSGVITPIPVTVPGSSTRERLRSAVEEAERDVLFLQAEEHAAREHLADSGQPEGFGLALSVLTYLAATSIAIPSGFLVFAQVALPAWGRVAFVAAFLSGVALLLWYLVVYAQYLDGSRPALPRWFWGLLPSSRRHLRRLATGTRQGLSDARARVRARRARTDT